MKSLVGRYANLLIVAALCLASSVSATVFFVSPSGSDENTGSRKYPFRTIEHAKSVVRQLVGQGLQDPVTVYLRAGRYEISKNLIFGPKDSGSPQNPISYVAYRDEHVVWSGGSLITNWKVDDQGIWSAYLPTVQSGDWFFRQLTVNDERAVRARWPNKDGDLKIGRVDDAVRLFRFDSKLPSGDFSSQDTELVVFQNWSVTRGLIGWSSSSQLSTRTAMGWIGHGAYTTASPGKVAFLEHAREFLDHPGEWYLDRVSGTLYYKPRPGQRIENTIVEAPRLQRLLVLSGRRNNPVRNLRFEGIRFENVDFSFPALGFNEIQAAHFGTSVKDLTYVHPVAIECLYAEQVRFEHCRIAHINCSGIGFGPGSRDNVVNSCLIENIGGNGVMIGWRGEGRLESGMHVALDADWGTASDIPKGNEVSYSLIRSCGLDAFGAVGIFVAFSEDTLIRKNLVTELPYSGISVGYRWNTSPTSQARCLVEENRVETVMRRLADGGGIYTLGAQAGTVFRRNLIRDVQRNSYAHGGAPNNGIFIDQGSKGFLFEQNVILQTSGEPLRFNQSQPDWHQWKENYFGDQEASRREARLVFANAGPSNRQLRRLESLSKSASWSGPPKRRFLKHRRSR